MAWMRTWTVLLLGLAGLATGCCNWCERHCPPRYGYGAYPPPTAAYAAPMCCPPCPAPSSSWSAPTTYPSNPCPPGCRPG